MEPNDTILEAIETGLSSDNPGKITFSEFIGDNPNLDPSLDVDFFQVQLDAGDQVTIDINASDFGSPLDSILRLFDSAGNEVAFNDDFNSLDSFINFTASTSDTYYIGVSGYDNFFYDPFVEGSGGNIGFRTGDYDVEISVIVPFEIIGTPDDDLLRGTTGYDIISGLDGNDRIVALAGNDTIFGDRGNDLISGGDGNDSISGGLGVDRIFGNKGDDDISSGDGIDIIFGGDGNDLISGEAGKDRIFGGNNSDYLDGGNGNDKLIGVNTTLDFGAFEVDTLVGGAGNDAFVLGDATNVYYDDGNSSSTGEFDYALILDFDSSRDSIQLNGMPDLYRLDFFISGSGTQDVAILYDPGTSAKDETIGIVQNVSTSLSLSDSSFIFV